MGVGDVSPGAIAKRRSLHILLVDDDWMGRAVAAAVLEELGHQVTTANGGTEALARWDQGDCDLILMDVQMPEMDGYEATRQIRAREAHRGGHVPIIALTADTEAGDRQACLEAGMDDYVPKPVEAEVVAQAIDRHCHAAPAAGKAFAVEERSAGTAAPASGDGDVANTLSKLGFEPLPEDDETAPDAEIPEDVLARLEDDFGGVEPDVVLDEEALARLREMEERGTLSVSRILSLFIDSGERILPALRANLEGGRVAELRREAHTLKGNARDVGAHRLGNRCEQLEGRAREGNLDGAMELIGQIELAWGEARAALESYLPRPGSGAST